MVSVSSSEASASLGSLCCFLWSGDGVSCGRLGGGPGLCSGGFFRSKTCHKHTCRNANTSYRRNKMSVPTMRDVLIFRFMKPVRVEVLLDMLTGCLNEVLAKVY